MTTAKKILIVFVLAFFLNLIWENLHAALYFLPSGQPITELLLLRSTLSDAIFISFLGILFFKIDFFKKRIWLTLIIGVITAIIVEKYSLATGRWAYNELMPIIPIIKTGLTPTLQLGLLSYIIFVLVGKISGTYKLYRCKECGLVYEDKSWMKKCKNWCKKNHSCNLEITSHAKKI